MTRIESARRPRAVSGWAIEAGVAEAVSITWPRKHTTEKMRMVFYRPHRVSAMIPPARGVT